MSLITRPSHVFQCTWEKSGRPGQLRWCIRHHFCHGLLKWWQRRHHYITKLTRSSQFSRMHWKTWKGLAMRLLRNNIVQVSFHILHNPSHNNRNLRLCYSHYWTALSYSAERVEDIQIKQKAQHDGPNPLRGFAASSKVYVQNFQRRSKDG